MFPNLGVRGSRSVCFHDRLILDVSFLTLFFRAISASFFLVTFFLVISPCFFRFFLFKCGLEPRSLVFHLRFSGRSILQEFFFKNSFWYDFILFFFRDYFWCAFSQFLVFEMLFAAVLCCNHAFLFGSYCFDIQFVFEEIILLIFRAFDFRGVVLPAFSLLSCRPFWKSGVNGSFSVGRLTVRILFKNGRGYHFACFELWIKNKAKTAVLISGSGGSSSTFHL